MAGGEEPFVTTGGLGQAVNAIRKKTPNTVVSLVPGAGHFFLLTHHDLTVAKLREWIGRGGS